MGKQGLKPIRRPIDALLVLALALLSGCAALEKGGGYAANPIVVGSVSVASQQQCQQYAGAHAEDAATLRDYLTTTAGAINGCVAGLNAGLATPK